MPTHVSSKKTLDRMKKIEREKSSVRSLVWRFVNTFRKRDPKYNRNQGIEYEEEFALRVTGKEDRFFVLNRKNLFYPTSSGELAVMAANLDLTIEDRELLVELWREDNNRIMYIPQTNGKMRKNPVFTGDIDEVFDLVMNAERSDLSKMKKPNKQKQHKIPQEPKNAPPSPEPDHCCRPDVRVLIRDFKTLTEHRHELDDAVFQRFLEIAYHIADNKIEVFSSRYNLDWDWFKAILEQGMMNFYETDEALDLFLLEKLHFDDGIIRFIREGRVLRPLRLLISEYRAAIWDPIGAKVNVSKENGSSSC